MDSFAPLMLETQRLAINGGFVQLTACLMFLRHILPALYSFISFAFAHISFAFWHSSVSHTHRCVVVHSFARNFSFASIVRFAHNGSLKITRSLVHLEIILRVIYWFVRYTRVVIRSHPFGRNIFLTIFHLPCWGHALVLFLGSGLCHPMGCSFFVMHFYCLSVFFI